MDPGEALDQQRRLRWFAFFCSLLTGSPKIRLASFVVV
jgi:hypothetical protein